ncbi:hypothetical protein PG985_001334 [Apiospora marii]|uniref:uncharacterized protein n=1 Tax=Apiospora marii TaxID=335849 RepID=UPI00312FCF59
MRPQPITVLTGLLVSLATCAPVAKPAEAIYGNPETATLPYNVNSLNVVEKREVEGVYGNPKTATLPYAVNSLNMADKRGEAAYGHDSLTPNVK